MTDNNHPITPSPELVRQWWDGTHGAFYEFEAVVTQAARWGADMELEACKEWVSWRHSRHESDELLFARRPKPLSLKEEALAVLDDASNRIDAAHENIIRRAIESLPD